MEDVLVIVAESSRRPWWQTVAFYLLGVAAVVGTWFAVKSLELQAIDRVEAAKPMDDGSLPAVAVAVAAGLFASRIDGSALVYNCRDPLLPDLLICRREYAEQVLAAVAGATDLLP